MTKSAFRVLVLLMIMAILIPGQVFAQSPQPQALQAAPSEVTLTDVIDLGSAAKTTDGRAQVIVELQDPPLALYSGGVLQFAPTRPSPNRKLDVNSPASQAYIQHLENVQGSFITSLSHVVTDVEVGYRYQVAFNGMALSLPIDQVKALASQPGVKQVYPDQIRTIETDTSMNIIQASALWEQLGGQADAGRGIKIADVDSGITADSDLFSGDGFTMPPGFPRGYCVTNPSDPDFKCTNKLIAARFYDRPSSGIAPDEFDSPKDFNGHGTHTAGTAAGNIITIPAGDIVPTDTVISGVAPGAYIMAYKALWETNDYKNASGTDSALIAALNDTVIDGADVVNNSWGGGAGDPNVGPYKTVIAALKAAGEVVVFSAGNDGPDGGTIGCPGCVEDAITVAASNNSRIFANTMDVTAPATVPANLVGMAALQGSTGTTNPAITSNISGQVVFAGDVDDTNITGCKAFPADSMTGKVALISRGGCTFTEKVTYAEDAGAIFTVIYNNAGGPPSVMSVEGTHPSVMISLDNGQALINYIQAHPGQVQTLVHKEIVKASNPTWANVMAGFSSAGPNGDPDVLKPDITAPGVNILSSYSPVSGGNFAFLQGTSMAAPHITGSAALMVALHPDWSPDQIKTALTSTSVQGMIKPDGVTAADPFNMGAGLVNLERAAAAGLTFDKASFASSTCVVNCSWNRTIKNVSSTSETWTAEVQAAPGMKVTVEPSTFTASAGLQGDFSVTADVTKLEPDQWYFGAIVWKDSSGHHPDAYLPLAVRPVLSSHPDALSMTVALSNPVVTDTVISGSPVTYTIQLANMTPVTTTFDIVDPLPAGSTYVDGSAQGLTYDPATKSLSAKANLSKAMLGVVSTTDSPGGFLPLSGFDSTLTVPCTPGTTCDEGLFNFNLGSSSYIYNGVPYNRIGMSSNGYAVVGGGTSADISSTPQQMPNPASPNNVLAPFWADLDFSDAGHMYLNILSDGVTDWLVLEWNGVPQFGTTSPLYNFQTWIQLDDSGQIWYTYGAMGSTSGFPIAVGAEDITGSSGKSYFYQSSGESSGTAPTTDDELKIAIVPGPGGQATYQFAAILTGKNNDIIANAVHVVNNQDSKNMVAVAKTNIFLYTSWLPFVSVNP